VLTGPSIFNNRRSRHFVHFAVCCVASLAALTTSGYSPMNLLLSLLPTPLLKPRHNTTLQFRDGHIFARKELARGDGIVIFVIDARRAGCYIPSASVHRKFDFNVCGKHVPHPSPGAPRTTEPCAIVRTRPPIPSGHWVRHIGLGDTLVQ